MNSEDIPETDDGQLPIFEGQSLVITGPKGTQTSDIRDYRERLHARLSMDGSDALPDLELLELLLFRALPRCDVRPVARRLLDSFGDLGWVISAPTARLTEIRGVGNAVALDLKVVLFAAQRIARAKVMDRPVIAGWNALLDYCHTTMAHREIEFFRVLFLDRKNTLIADEDCGSGTVDHVPVYPREVIKRALELNASALNLVHNHPSGDPTPSQADIDVTNQIRDAGAVMGIVLHDHIIVGKSTEVSFRAQDLI